jgi:hypothetical protein
MNQGSVCHVWRVWRVNFEAHGNHSGVVALAEPRSRVEQPRFVREAA